jgi:RHS repeat-associated protein
VTRRYFAQGELIPASSTQLYYAQDQIGSVRDVVTVQNGVRVASYDYEPYGSPSQTAGRIGADFRYAGLFYEPNSGLYLSATRAYDSNQGRWLSRDPIKEEGGLNLYSYTGASPIRFIDITGLDYTDSNGVLHSNDGTIKVVVHPMEPVGPSGSEGSDADGLSGASAVGGSYSMFNPCERGTFQIGFGGSFKLPNSPFSVSFGAGFASDANGGFGVYGYSGAMPSFGSGANFGLQFAVSDALSIEDLSGPFYNASANFGGIDDIGADVFAGPSPDGDVNGVGATIGPGIGVYGSAGSTNTVIIPLR